MYRVEYTEKERDEALKISRSGAIALFIYTSNILVNGEVKRYSEDKTVRAVKKGGVTFVPISFFSDFLDAAVMKTENGYTVTKAGKTAAVSFSGCGEAFSFLKNGVVYAPVCYVASEIGYSAGEFYEDRLVVIGNGAHINAIKQNPLIAEALSYEIFGEYVTDNFTHEDYVAAKDNWRLRLVGSPKINNLSDSFVVEKIAAIDKRCKARLDSLNRRSEKGEDPVILWGDEAPTASADLTRQYNGVYDLAQAYGTYGSEYYQSEELLSVIIYTLDWMYEHMYGEAEIAGQGWRDVRIYNWWDWHVGGPENLTNTLLVIEDKLTYEEKKRYLKCYEWVTTILRASTENRACASSRLKNGTKTALLLEDPVRLKKAQWDCDTLLGIEEYGEGPHKDYVQWTHNFPHNVSYALGNLQRTLFTSSILASTALDFSGPKKYNQFMLLKYTFEPAMYRGQGFVMFSGRSTAGRELNAGAAILAGLLPMIGVYGEDEDRYIEAMIKRNSALSKMRDKVRSQCSIHDLATYNRIIDDESLSYENTYEYAHAWFTGDRAAQHRNNYAVGIALSSEREISYECINGINKRGWYTGDGALYLYTDYDCEQYDGDNFITKNLRVAYNFPGTTEDSQARVERSILNNEAWHNPSPFAGSMQIQDKYLVCGMDFVSMNFEGPDKNIVDTGYGSGLAVHCNDLVAKKAWFCFDDEIVVLGAGINSTMNSDVHTTVEHKRIVGENDCKQIIAGQNGAEIVLDKDSKVTTENAAWALMEGHAGYVFFEEGALTSERYTSEESAGQEFFLLNLEHGKNPKNAGYAYAIVPYATKESLKAYVENCDVKIISNTADVQAVRESTLGITGCVFHSAGILDGVVSASVPSLVTIVEKDGVLEILVCDPTHKLEDGEFIIPRALKPVDCSNNLSVSVSPDKTVVKADFVEAHGRTYKATFSVN